MKALRLLCHAAAFAVVLMLGTSLAHAQATRTWVSGLGDDANPCSRTAPCKTLPGAYSKTAVGGEIDCLDPGGFGTISIGHSLTIDCGDGDGGYSGSILATSGINAININATATANVNLRNIGINCVGQSAFPGGSGIVFNTGAYVHVQSVEILGCVNGISVNNAAYNITTVRNSVINDSSQSGMNLVCAGFCTASLDNVQISNAVTGIHASTNATVSVQRSIFMGPQTGASNGLLADAGNAIINVDNSLIAFWSNGVNAAGGGNAHVSNSTINNCSSFGVTGNVGTTNPPTNRFFNNVMNGTFSATVTNLL
jgi:hypothetical protein